MLAVFAFTLFTSALLLFMVQPMIGKMITPLLGGTPAVWNTCMVFFQVALLAGYSYAHATTAWLGVRRQALLHLGILLTPFIFFVGNYFLLGRPLAVSRTVIEGGLNNPVPQLLLLLVMSVGVPFFVISTSAPLLQKWFTNTTHPEARDPYFLYGASNLGSMIALLGYPVLVEPYLGLTTQTWVWMVCYGLLVLMIGGCVAFMWFSPEAQPEPEPQPAKEASALAMAGAARGPTDAIVAGSAKLALARGRGKERRRGDRPRRDEPAAEGVRLPEELSGDVTWMRRLRWVALAAVPSSLMLGATTYMTTDIAAITYLWVLPLALYLLSFIIVFSKVPSVVHKVFVLALPLVLLLLIFMMVSDVKPYKMAYTIGIHLATLFVVSMVCHGELARNRPSAGHLTEFFLWMSVGGVVGGMFNGLVAPIIFDGLYEYPLAMVVACLLLPPLGLTADSNWGYIADLTLAGLCLTVGSLLIGIRVWENDIRYKQVEYGPYLWLAVGVLFILGLGLFAVMRLRGDQGRGRFGLPLLLTVGLVAFNVLGVFLVYVLTPHVVYNEGTPTWWMMAVVVPALILVCIGVNVGAVIVLYKRRASDEHLQSWLDLLMPLAILVLTAGLVWGLRTDLLSPTLSSFASEKYFSAEDLLRVLTFGIPAVLCYTFVERSLRFGLSVGAMLLAAGFTGTFAELTIFQERSFFGVLKVLYQPGSRIEVKSHLLYHGTTLHGRQYLHISDPEFYRDNPDWVDSDGWPLTYYHRTGPIGNVCEAYNEPWRNIGVIGLGTGTMACYAQEGQRITFYDIDPLVRRISYDTKYFTFIQKAKDRGADVNLLMGDARLVMERQQLPDDQKYHILVVDAFSSDAIPIHLITYEALLMYLDHTAEDGLICFHVSNRYLELKPVLANLVKKHRDERGPLVGYFMEDISYAQGKAESTWVVIARDRKHLAKLRTWDDWDKKLGLKDFDPAAPTEQWDAIKGLAKPMLLNMGFSPADLEPCWFPLQEDPAVGAWTDDYASLFRVFRW
jgi:hypothetical protein